MKRSIKDWLIVLLSLVDDAAAALFLLFILWLLNIPISWLTILLLVAFFAASVYVIHKLVIPVLHQRVINGTEGMVGLEGKVIEPLLPEGLIKVKEEYWKARAINDQIAAGQKVEIIGFNGLVLKVKLKGS